MCLHLNEAKKRVNKNKLVMRGAYFQGHMYFYKVKTFKKKEYGIFFLLDNIQQNIHNKWLPVVYVRFIHGGGGVINK